MKGLGGTRARHAELKAWTRRGRSAASVARWIYAVHHWLKAHWFRAVAGSCTLVRLVSAMHEFAALAQSRLALGDRGEVDYKAALLMLLALPRATSEDGWQNQP